MNTNLKNRKTVHYYRPLSIVFLDAVNLNPPLLGTPVIMGEFKVIRVSVELTKSSHTLKKIIIY